MSAPQPTPTAEMLGKLAQIAMTPAALDRCRRWHVAMYYHHRVGPRNPASLHNYGNTSFTDPEAYSIIAPAASVSFTVAANDNTVPYVVQLFEATYPNPTQIGNDVVIPRGTNFPYQGVFQYATQAMSCYFILLWTPDTSAPANCVNRVDFGTNM